MNQQEACLQARHGEDVVFLGCRLSGELRGLMFEAQVEQGFRNPGKENIEVAYTFPLPWGAVLLGVEVLLGDKHLSGRVVEKAQAEARYEEALSEGDAAIMLEKNADHSYCLNLGNLAAGEACTITLRYAQTLPFEQGSLRLLIPTVIAPRYGDAVRDGGLRPHQAPEHSLSAEYPFLLEIRLHDELARARIASPSHPVGFARTMTESGEVVTVSLARQATLDRDFILQVDQLAHDALAISATDTQDADSTVILASFCPRLPSDGVRGTSVKLLVDCSGSMGGDSIEAARRALAAIVQQLEAGDQFSLSRFGSTVEHRSRGLWQLTAITRKAAERWVSELSANLGGTEMEAALDSTFALAKTVPCDVLLVTDGEISAIDSTIETARQSGHRLFIVGIGSSPAETHLRRLAEASGGACDFVAPGEAVEPAVLRMFARLRSPRLSELALAWPEGMVPQWVSPLPRSVFDGDSCHVFAWLGQAAEGKLRLLGRLSEGSALQEISVVALSHAPSLSDTLPRLAASVRCQSESAESSVQRAVDYQLITQETNFLLVHEREAGEKATDMPELHKVRQMMAAGWGRMGSALMGTPAPQGLPMPPGGIATGVCCPAPGGNSADRTVEVRTPRPDPRHRIDSEHYKGLSPLGFAEWLHSRQFSAWPKRFADLQQIGLGSALSDWLELVFDAPEEALVASFCYLMSREETHLVLQKSEAFHAALFSRLAAGLAGESPAVQAAVKLPLLETMRVALTGMTDCAWPDQVFSLEAATENAGG